MWKLGTGKLGQRKRGREVGGEGGASQWTKYGSQLLLTIHGQYSMIWLSLSEVPVHVHALLPAKQTTTTLPTEFPIQT
jgi:hypothetical protein